MKNQKTNSLEMIMTGKKLTVLIGIVLCVFFQQRSLAQTETHTFPSGTAIIDMGAATPTVGNSLKPYGLVYALLKDKNVPVYWAINPAKAKDGTDFVYNGKVYRGGAFIVSKEYFRPSVITLINSFINQGVIIDYTSSDLTLNGLFKLNFAPKWTMDRTNGGLSVSILTTAGIPSSAYSFKYPSELNSCDDIFVLPHADPSWEVHRNLLLWNKTFRGNIWAGCNAVSVLENISKDTVITGEPFPVKMNFLSTTGLVPYTDHQIALPPFAEKNPGVGPGQYIGITDNAQQNGAESIYLPKSGGGWNPGTTILTLAPTHADIPTLSSGEAVKNIYGRAFNDPSRGYVCYQASHNINGSSADAIAAQRIFLNFSFFALKDKSANSVTNALSGVPSEMRGGVTYNGFSGAASGGAGPFTYQWLVSIGGSFSTPTSATTSYTPDPSLTTATEGVMTCIATDACGRRSISSLPFTAYPPTPPLTVNSISKNVTGDCPVNSISFNVFDDNVDANAGSRTLTAVSGFSNGTVSFSASGAVTYTSNSNFKGTDLGTYTLSNGTATNTGNISLTVGTVASAPVAVADTISAAQDNITQVNVILNDKSNQAASNGSLLYIKDITQKPSKGFVYINTNGTLSYLSKSNLSGTLGTDNFKYLACNTAGYCSEANVLVNLVASGCLTGTYKAGIDQPAITATRTLLPEQDATMVSDGFHYNDPFGGYGTTETTAHNGNTLQLGGNSGFDDLHFPVLKFGLGSIPTANINSASLVLRATTAFTINDLVSFNQNFPASIFRLTQPWDENINWQKYDASNNWNDIDNFIYNDPPSAGGTDYKLATETPALTPATDPKFDVADLTTIAANGTISATVTSLAKLWKTTPADNYGLIIKPQTGTTNALNALFYSREAAGNDSLKPRLLVTWDSVAAVTYSCVAIPANYKPFAYADTASTLSTTPVTIDALANDLNYYGTLTARNTTITGVSATTPHGTAAIVSGKVVYTPAGNYVGVDTITYTITDATNSQSNTATIRVNVKRVAPTVVRDNSTTPSSALVAIGVGANDTDPQGSGILSAPTITAFPKNGTAVVVGDSIKYTPAARFTGKDTLIYKRLGDSTSCVAALSDTALVVITVTNRPPVAVNDTISTFACTPVEIKIKDNDSDPEGATLTAVLVSNPSHGSVVLSGQGYTYTPDSAYTGTDAFTYKVKDGSPDSLQSNTATVVITVSGSANPNLAPKAVADNDSTWVNSQVVMNVLQNDSDPNKDPFTISITAAGLKAPAHGTIQLLANKMIRYLPATNYVGRDTFEYRITDVHPSCVGNSSLSATAKVIIKIKSLPIFTSGTIWNDENLSGKEDFTDIYTSPEVGTNADGAVYVYLTDSTNAIIDYTAVNSDGTYQLSSVPSFTPKLNLLLSTEQLSVGGKLTKSSLPSGYTNTSPTIRKFNSGSADLTGYDWGIVTSTVSPGTITTTSEVYCINITTIGALTSVSSASIGATVQWQASTVSAGSGFVNIANATSTGYAPAGPVTITTWYRRKASLGGQPPVYSNVITLTPQASISGAISGGAISVCAAVNSGTLTLSGYTGSILKWQSSTNGGTTYTDIAYTDSVYNFSNINATTRYRALVQMSTCSIATTEAITVTVDPVPVLGPISGPCALARDSFGVYRVTPTGMVTRYNWQLSSGWTGSSDSSSIRIKAGIATGMLTVTAYNGACTSNSSSYKLTVIDYAQVTISATPVVASGNLTSTMVIKIQLIDTDGNNINCSGGVATLCTSSGTFSAVIDNNDGTYTSFLTSTANTPEICGTVGGIPIQKKIKVTFTGPQGGIKPNGPILATDIPKLTFTMTAGSGPYTVIYRSEKSTKNDTLTNVISGVRYSVAQIPSTTLYRLVSIIDANGERRDNNFDRDTATVVVLAPKIIVTLKADAPVIEKDSTWRTRLTLHVKNIGDLDLANVQVKLNLQDVFPNPVTYVLDSVRVSGTTVVQNPVYDGLRNNDLFSKNHRKPARIDINNGGALESSGMLASLNSTIDGTAVEVYGDAATAENEESDNDNDGSSTYMFGASSQLPIGVDGFMYLYLHIRPNGYYEPFVLQAVATGTGHTEEGAALATSLSNDNENTAAHPDITKQGDPLPTVINLIPNPLIGASLAATTPVDKGDGTYDVTLSYRLRNYGNVNLQSLQLFQNLGRMIGSPSTFTLVGGITATGTLVTNPLFDAKIDTNMLQPISELAYGAEGTLQFKINIRPNQLSSLYRLQATATGTYGELNIKNTDLSNDGTDPDPDGNKIPSEKLITIIAINQPIPPLAPGKIGIDTIPPARATVLTKKYCTSVTGAVVVSTSSNTGGTGVYEWQWQSSTNNTSFTDIAGATDSVYTTGTLTSSIYLRRRIISDNQVGYSNAVYLQIVTPVKPVISPAGPLTLPFNGTVTLSSSAAATYTWSTGASTLSITVALPGSFTVTTKDANGCTVASDPVTVKPPPPQTVDATYILGNTGNPANSGIQVTAMTGATLNYYLVTTGGVSVPVPVLPSVVGVFTYYVSETLNGVESDRVPYKVTIIDKVADIEKVLSKAPVLQPDGSFLQAFSIRLINKRSELLDSVRVKDDLSKVFPAGSTFEIVELKASGKLVANTLYNGASQVDMLANGSQLPGLQTDSINLTVKLFPNGFTGTLNNPAELTAKSPFGVFRILSNDPKASDGLTVRAPAKFTIPAVDIFIPSGFSPNHDGTNDVWAISKPYNTKLTADVFNRWGNLVFRSPEYKNEFDGKGNQPGTMLGTDLPDGTYYYIVVATDKTTGATRKFAGYLTLKR